MEVPYTFQQLFQHLATHLLIQRVLFTEEFTQQLPACGSLGIKQQQILNWEWVSSSVV